MLRLRAPWVEAAGGGSASRRANFRPQHSHFVFARPRISRATAEFEFGSSVRSARLWKKFGLLLTQKRHLK